MLTNSTAGTNAYDPDSDSHYPGREPLAKSPHEPSVMEKGLRATATRQE